MKRSVLKFDNSYQSLEDKDDESVKSSEKKQVHGNEFLHFNLERVIQKIESAKSKKRRLPFEEEDEAYYNSYMINIMKFIEEQRELIEDLYCTVYECNIRAVKSFRKLLTKGENTPINEVIEIGLLPKFVECLGSSESPMQYEAAWLITNMTYCSTVQKRFIIESGAVDALVNLLWSGCENVHNQAVWALGNIVGDDGNFGAYVLQKGALPGVIHVVKTVETEPVLLTCAWTLKNLCCGASDPNRLLQVLPVIGTFLYHTHKELVSTCLKILISLSNKKVLANEMINIGIHSELIQLIQKAKGDILHHSLQVIANITDTHDPRLTQSLFDSNILEILKNLLDSEDKFSRTQVCLIVNRITCGNQNEIQAVIESDIFSDLLNNINKESDEETLSYTVSSVCNVVSRGNLPQIQYLMRFGIVRDLCSILAGSSDSIVEEVLNCLDALLKVGEFEAGKKVTFNKVAIQMEESRGIQSLELLLSHESENVYNKAYELMETYFNHEEEPIHASLEETHTDFISHMV